jgi:hypothetical protein
MATVAVQQSGLVQVAADEGLAGGSRGAPGNYCLNVSWSTTCLRNMSCLQVDLNLYIGNSTIQLSLSQNNDRCTDAHLVVEFDDILVSHANASV